jgi:UMF1 family MFS transporter
MSAGVQTVVYLASTFAEKELRFEASELIMIILLLQIVAIAGAWLFAVISSKTSNKTGLLLAVSIWAVICVAAYFIQGKTQFYFLAGAVGMVLGGVQSLARSSYGKMIRGYQGDLTSFYSFYDVVFKVAIVMGTLVFGMVDQIMGGMRLSILALGIFFIIAFILYSMVRFQPNGQAQTGLGSLPVTDGITEER